MPTPRQKTWKQIFANWRATAVQPRLDLLRIIPQTNLRYVFALVGLNIPLALLPVGFIFATSAVVGAVPEAVAGGVDSPAWTELVRAFLLAAAFFVAQQCAAPFQTYFSEKLRRDYDGQLLVDGVDLRRIELASWRARIAAGFQDFVRFQFSAREAVSVGDLPMIDDDDAVLSAIDRAQAGAIMQRLPEGLGTKLGLSQDGTDLSGGQWQRLALSRAMMRTDPLLLVLDEPTSALDAQAEHDLFERYVEQAQQVGMRTGAITVLVSHRLSTVRMADLIVVIDDGNISEFGTHLELIALPGGLYAELFSLQAQQYQ